LLMEMKQHNRHSDYAMGWTIWGYNPRFLSSPKHTDQLWDPPNLLLSGYWVSFPGVQRPGYEVYPSQFCSVVVKKKGKAIPRHTRTGPEGSRRLRIPNFKTIGQ